MLGMTRRRTLPVVVPVSVLAATALLLAGCSGSGDDDATAGPSSSAAASPGATATAGPGDPLTAAGTCDAFYRDGDTPLERRVGEALVRASENGLDGTSADTLHALGITLARLQQRAPEEFQDAIHQVYVPFEQLQEHLDGGAQGGSVSVDAASAAEGLKTIRALCDEVTPAG